MADSDDREVLAFGEREVFDKEALYEAFLKLQQVRESNHFCCISLASDYDYVWDVRFEYSGFGPQAVGNRDPSLAHGKLTACDHTHYTLIEAIDHFHQWWLNGGDLSKPITEGGA